MKSSVLKKAEVYLFGYEQAVEKLETERQSLKRKERELQRWERGTELVLSTAKDTQEAAVLQVTDLANSAIHTIFGDQYSFSIELQEKRGQIEAVPLFYDQDNAFDPRAVGSGGMVEVAAFAMKLSLYLLTRETRPIFLLDEIFRGVSQEYVPALGEFLRTVCEEFGIQIIMTTHIRELTKFAHKHQELRG